jgi:GT2 family glycosyltransferase
MNKLVSIIVLTYNSEKYIEDCLNSVFAQTYKNLEVIVIDSASQDNTVKLIGNWKLKIENFKFIENKFNLGYAKGNNIGIKESSGEYVVILNPDVTLDENFIQKIVDVFESDEKIGSIQAKVLQLNNGQKTKIIDTVGFKFFKSGRVIDIGQGEEDSGQYDNFKKIFGANGAVPAYRRIALNDIELKEEYFDEDFFCYVEDFDLAWRLNAQRWQSILEPQAIAWHDRTSSKSIGGGWKEFRRTRKLQSLWLRKISWRNIWLTFIKNLPLKGFFHPQFIKRQIKFAIYLLFFEPRVLLVKFQILKLLPKILRKRKLIMKNKKC